MERVLGCFPNKPGKIARLELNFRHSLEELSLSDITKINELIDRENALGD
jgi:hypothetical protein